MSETALVRRLRWALDHANPDPLATVTLERRDVTDIIARLLHGCGERNEPVAHPQPRPRPTL